MKHFGEKEFKAEEEIIKKFSIPLKDDFMEYYEESE